MVARSSMTYMKLDKGSARPDRCRCTSAPKVSHATSARNLRGPLPPSLKWPGLNLNANQGSAQVWEYPWCSGNGSCRYRYGIQNANLWLYRNPYCSIMGLYRYRAEIFYCNVYSIILFYYYFIYYMGGKTTTM